MMRIWFFAVVLMPWLSAPLAVQAQDLAPPQPVTEAVETVEQDTGLSGSVTDDSDYRNLEIAIAAFATDRDVSTPANASGTSALGTELARVVFNDLRNNGLFEPTGPDALPRPSFAQITAPAWSGWSQRSTEMLVHGYVQARGDGRLTVGCYLYDVALQDELARAGWIVPPRDWRRAAHKCADLIYSRLTGESPFFDSKIAYIAETGPKDNRTKRLAIMDSDGANHRFVTTGGATALTPRYSPDYSRLLYLSYVDGNPRIYIYDIGSGRQTLVTENANPTFAPRWSPDGRSILYSMAVAGNTDIYRVPSQRRPRNPADQYAGHRYRRQLFARRQTHRVRIRPFGQPADLCYGRRRIEPEAAVLLRRARRNTRMVAARRPDRLHAHRGQFPHRGDEPGRRVAAPSNR